MSRRWWSAGGALQGAGDATRDPRGCTGPRGHRPPRTRPSARASSPGGPNRRRACRRSSRSCCPRLLGVIASIAVASGSSASGMSWRRRSRRRAVRRRDDRHLGHLTRGGRRIGQAVADRHGEDIGLALFGDLVRRSSRSGSSSPQAPRVTTTAGECGPGRGERALAMDKGAPGYVSAERRRDIGRGNVCLAPRNPRRLVTPLRRVTTSRTGRRASGGAQVDDVPGRHGATAALQGLHDQVAFGGHVDRRAHDVVVAQIDAHPPPQRGRAASPLGHELAGTATGQPPIVDVSAEGTPPAGRQSRCTNQLSAVASVPASRPAAASPLAVNAGDSPRWRPTEWASVATALADRRPLGRPPSPRPPPTRYAPASQVSQSHHEHRPMMGRGGRSRNRNAAAVASAGSGQLASPCPWRPPVVGH